MNKCKLGNHFHFHFLGRLVIISHIWGGFDVVNVCNAQKANLWTPPSIDKKSIRIPLHCTDKTLTVCNAMSLYNREAISHMAKISFTAKEGY